MIGSLFITCLSEVLFIQTVYINTAALESSKEELSTSTMIKFEWFLHLL